MSKKDKNKIQTKFYVDKKGAYLGGFSGAKPPIGAVEVTSPPDDGRQIYDGNRWKEADNTWGEVRDKQKEMIEAVFWKIERHITQIAYNGIDRADISLSDDEYQGHLAYIQAVRAHDKKIHETAKAALAGLSKLKSPE